MPWNALFARFLDAVKEHWKQSPLPILIYYSWGVLPTRIRVLVLSFGVLVLTYDLVKWRYKVWESSDVSPYQKRIARILHYTVSLLLIGPPLACIAVCGLQRWAPVLIDGVAVSAIRDTNSPVNVTAYTFGVGNPHPTNYSGSIIGMADATGARLFETQHLFQFAGNFAVMGVGKTGSYCLLVGVIGLFCLGIYESIAESMFKLPPINPDDY